LLKTLQRKKLPDHFVEANKMIKRFTGKGFVEINSRSISDFLPAEIEENIEGAIRQREIV
jgi:hypothetical protein